MEIKGDNYTVWIDNHNNTINFTGSLRLGGMEEYAPILNLLNSAANNNPESVILDLQNLNFLNSSGISMLSKFVIEMRKRKAENLKIIGSNLIPWQGKSLKNLQRLMPSLVLELQ
ncbi:slr1659 superfamily regulator [Calothrix sp. NIES-3974]|uniref:slr1659 superfamily regulator n=1 Tax=Calothrix sp. NIES-3974 TaxID=2005462 RepID=UPI000B5E9E0A|nr:STAS domain-containing protein [Calothrix sp. NIES-3974]BAZ07398.1 hypothetical protein NIES3974_40610 [Calothrix sp. NIES-3974]